MNDTTSISLLEKLQREGASGNWRSFAAIYEPMILKWLMVQRVPRQEAEDVRQEVMAIVIREIPKFDHNRRKGAFRKWLRSVTSNQITAYYRSRRRTPLATGDDKFLEMAQQLEDPDSPLSRNWDEEHNRYIILHLLEMIQSEFSEKNLKAFRLIVLEGRAAAEAAKAVGSTENAVRIAQSRITRRLRDLGRGLLD